MSTERIVAAIRSVTDRVVDAVDAELWRIEQREKLRQQHTIRPGEEAKYQRVHARLGWQPKERDE